MRPGLSGDLLLKQNRKGEPVESEESTEQERETEKRTQLPSPPMLGPCIYRKFPQGYYTWDS